MIGIVFCDIPSTSSEVVKSRQTNKEYDRLVRHLLKTDLIGLTGFRTSTTFIHLKANKITRINEVFSMEA